jgi:cytochrome c-type biogenesis protein
LQERGGPAKERIMALSVSILSAAAGGAISFLSPCVLPLVPPYLVYVSGISLDSMQDAKAADRGRVIAAALAFVAGFTTVFVLLGATASYAGQVLRDNITLLSSVAGVFIILMGLHFLGIFRIGLFNREVRYHGASKPAGLLGAYGVGLAFAFGWTPCIGPVLAAILSIAAQDDSVTDGMFLLGVYSLGLPAGGLQRHTVSYVLPVVQAASGDGREGDGRAFGGGWRLVSDRRNAAGLVLAAGNLPQSWQHRVSALESCKRWDQTWRMRD